MEYISSDTNVWIDFSTIGFLDCPFRLDWSFYMYEEAVEEELLNPPGISEELISYGIISTELSEDEFHTAEMFGRKYKKLSSYDCIALSIARERGIKLMTGDYALRKAACSENVDVIGTLGVIDALMDSELIDKTEYIEMLTRIMLFNGREIWLPMKEIMVRLESARE